MEKSKIRCQLARCKYSIKAYGENYHSVYPLTAFGHEAPPKEMPDAVAKCSRCGGVTNGEKWIYVCVVCGKEVPPGELYGFFVPHKCRECDQRIVAEEKKAGKICPKCHNTYSYCCC